MNEPEGIEEWAAQVPEVMRTDPIWRLAAYRYSLYLGDLVYDDVSRMDRETRKRRIVQQLLDAVESISANIAEGCSRTSGPERAKFFEYAHSSAREAREWIYKARRSLPPGVADKRLELATRIMRILAVSIPRERAMRETRARTHTHRQPATNTVSQQPTVTE